MAMAITSKRTFPRQASAIGPNRQHARDVLADALGDRSDDAILLTSEALTNAVQNSNAETIDVSIVTSAANVRIEVSTPGGDGWGSGPELRVPDIEDPAGRGVFLIDALSDRWGTRAADSMLWFEFELARRA
jgi:anti-sigma regulatory factor (Ser/Thr protein kinase)